MMDAPRQDGEAARVLQAHRGFLDAKRRGWTFGRAEPEPWPLDAQDWKSGRERVTVSAIMSKTESLSCDIAIIGGGIAGLTAAVALGSLGFEVTCVDAQPPQPEKAPELDGRTTALLQGSVRALALLDVWPRCEAAAEGLWVMRIVDESGRREPGTVTFDSREMEEAPFGYNVPNAALRQALLARIAGMKGVRHLAPVKLETLRFESAQAVAELADGRSLSASLAIGADGRNSRSREAAGIVVKRWTYGQTAMAFSLSHSHPHEGVSTEFHRTSGPFVLVPMPGNRSSVVWVERERAAPGFLALDEGSFRHAVQERTRGVLGTVEQVGPRFSYPVGTLLAERYAAHRLALIGESAHALPPVGAQGLNLGITDVATLAEVLVEARRAGQDVGAEAVLERYESRRRPDVVARVFAIDGLNRAVKTRFPPFQALRHLGLAAVERVPGLKATLMRQGMQPVGEVPSLMRGIPLRPL